MNNRKNRVPADLSSALDHYSEIREKFDQEKPLLFLDFDGTLAPIVEHHEDAGITSEMRSLIKELAKEFPLAVVSGRGLADVRTRVELQDIYYAGSHGYEISGPNGFSKDNEEAVKVLPVFEAIEPLLKEQLKDISGVDFERKKYTLAIHYRQVAGDREGEVHRVVSEVLKDYPEVTKAEGKKVIEIRPAINWHKGRAVEFLKKELSRKEDPFSIYIGDDVTDEDAFRHVNNNLGILVGEHGQQTYADYRLENIGEVEQFFKRLLDPHG